MFVANVRLVTISLEANTRSQIFIQLERNHLLLICVFGT